MRCITAARTVPLISGKKWRNGWEMNSEILIQHSAVASVAAEALNRKQKRFTATKTLPASGSTLTYWCWVRIPSDHNATQRHTAPSWLWVFLYRNICFEQPVLMRTQRQNFRFYVMGWEDVVQHHFVGILLCFIKKCKNQQKSARGGWRYSGSISLIKEQVIFCQDLETVIALVKYKILTQTLLLNFYFTNNSCLSRILKIHPFTTCAVRFSNHFVSFLVRLQWQCQQSAFGCSLKASEEIYRSALQNKKIML